MKGIDIPLQVWKAMENCLHLEGFWRYGVAAVLVAVWGIGVAIADVFQEKVLSFVCITGI